jgi:Zn-dependent protease with chaperone function
MGFVLRRSLPSISGLVALLVAVGFAAVHFAGAPIWFPAAFAVGVLLLQFVVNPWLIQWLIPATVIDHDGGRYLTDQPVGEIVARQCQRAGVPFVKLGIVDDGTPNAFTFGHTPRDARIWITRGLLERVDERELEAVVAHEVGHIKHWDFVVMTVAAVIPMMLYLLYVAARASDRTEARAVAAGAYLSYLVSQLTLLALSRARETAADHWSCSITGDGDALASALVKIAYGMGEESGVRKEQAAALIASGKEGKKQAGRLRRHHFRTQSMRAMGIFEPRSADALQAVVARGVDPARAVAAMRWDVVNPWGRLLEKLSSHPLVARRIEALERSGLPGAPREWSVVRSLAEVPTGERNAVRARFGYEVMVAAAPWVVVVAGVVFGGAFLGGLRAVGIALLLAGALLVYKQTVRYPTTHVAASEVTSLLERLDASPVTGIPVELRGRIIGRGTPGYVLSPDLVLADDSGFLPMLYRQPIALLATLFGLFRAERFLGEEAVARGWYRRMPGPVLELRDVVIAGGGKRARSWQWVARYAGSVLVLAAGVVVLLMSLAV